MIEKVKDILEYIYDETFISIWDDDRTQIIWHGTVEQAKALHAPWLDYYFMDLQSFAPDYIGDCCGHGIMINCIKVG